MAAAKQQIGCRSALEVQDIVRVVFRGQTQDSRIVGISHTMSGDRWGTKLDLIPL